VATAAESLAVTFGAAESPTIGADVGSLVARFGPATALDDAGPTAGSAAAAAESVATSPEEPWRSVAAAESLATGVGAETLAAESVVPTAVSLRFGGGGRSGSRGRGRCAVGWAGVFAESAGSSQDGGASAGAAELAGAVDPDELDTGLAATSVCAGIAPPVIWLSSAAGPVSASGPRSGACAVERGPSNHEGGSAEVGGPGCSETARWSAAEAWPPPSLAGPGACDCGSATGYCAPEVCDCGVAGAIGFTGDDTCACGCGGATGICGADI